MTYTPKSKRGKERIIDPTPLIAMINLIERTSEEADKVVSAAMFAAKHTCDETQQRVFIQDFAAALNRRGLLSNNDVQPFREYGYEYMRGYE